MKNNLENIAFDEVKDINGKSYKEFRTELHTDFGVVKRDIIKGYACLIIILISSVALARTGFLNWFTFLLNAFLLGYCLAYLHLFIHEAAHYNIHPERKWNDKISDLILGVFFFIQVKEYRRIHWQHHLHLGTTTDTEHSYYNPLNALFILKSFMGVFAISVFLERTKMIKGTSRKHLNLRYLAYLIAFHTFLLIVLFSLGGWLIVSLWLVGLISVFPFFAVLRQLLEHRDQEASKQIDFTESNHGKTSRLFGDSFIDRSFGGAGFNKHLIHHWDPAISYTRLKETEAFLSNCIVTSELIRASKTHYLKTFVSLFKLT